MMVVAVSFAWWEMPLGFGLGLGALFLVDWWVLRRTGIDLAAELARLLDDWIERQEHDG